MAKGTGSATAAGNHTKIEPVTTQRAYTLRLRGTDPTDDSWRDALWATHEAINKGAKAFGNWLLTLRGGLSHELADAKVSAGKGKPDRDPTAEERRNRRILLALSWLSVEDECGAPDGELRVATGRDEPADRCKKVGGALHEILKGRRIPESEIGDPAKPPEDQPGTWIGDCAPSLSAAIRDDAVWVNRSVAFGQLTSSLAGLDQAYAEQLTFSFFGPLPDYFQLPGIDDEAAVSGGQEPAMGAIRNCGQHLLTLINDVLDLSKIESGRLEIERQDVDLQRLLVSVRDVLAQRATEKGVALVLDVAPEIPRGVHTDPTKLRQVLVNLAGNAVKFTEAGAVTIRVTEPKIGRFRFEVEDTGIGMSEQELADVFDAFRQAAAGKAAGGTGLGLAITKRVVEALGGEVEVVSTPGVGTTFAFEVPLEEVDELKLQPQDTDDLDDSTTLRLPEGRTVTVLVADDRRDNRDILDRFLSPIGCEVLHAENGREAIDKLEHAQVDIVLMDVRMPVMNGLEATRRIRQNPSLSGLLVIAVSASVFENQRERIKEAGCDDFIGKPLRAAELYRKLAEYLDLPLQHGDDHRPSAEPGADALEPDRAAAIADAIVESTAIGDVGSLDNLAKELLSGTAVEQALGRRIEPLVRGFDLEGLKAIAEQVREENQP